MQPCQKASAGLQARSRDPMRFKLFLASMWAIPPKAVLQAAPPRGIAPQELSLVLHQVMHRLYALHAYENHVCPVCSQQPLRIVSCSARSLS